jgi:hypothetical protein
VKKKIWANLLFTFYPKIVIKLSKKDVWDPGSKRHQISRILNTVSICIIYGSEAAYFGAEQFL